jgi:cation diffusion facilitator CzcD-associated flavoprotein CzcO
MRWLCGDASWLLESFRTQGRPDIVSRRRAATTFVTDFARPASYDYIDGSDPAPALAAVRVAAGKAKSRVERRMARRVYPSWPRGQKQIETDVDVAVIGAGPYGLSIAAHLEAAGVRCMVFGTRMGAWRNNMPAGMQLKSEGFASSLSSPDGDRTLEAFCRLRGLEYAAAASPVAVEAFVAYGEWFADQLGVPIIDEQVVDLAGREGEFVVKTDAAATYCARRIVVAVGTTAFAYLPSPLRELADRTEGRACSHSSAHADLGVFAGQRVAVVGAGQSALESAALLRELGAVPTVIARRDAVRWSQPSAPEPRPLMARLRRPTNGLTPGWKHLAAARLPGAYTHLPEARRLHTFTHTLGPTGAWWLRHRVEGRVATLVGTGIEGADVIDGDDAVRLRLRDRTGAATVLDADHVIAATGYRVDPSRLWFLGADLHADLRVHGQAPVLSSRFETTVPGLYLAGFASGPTFGPVMRFVVGADFTARRLTRALTTTH